MKWMSGNVGEVHSNVERTCFGSRERRNCLSIHVSRREVKSNAKEWSRISRVLGREGEGVGLFAWSL